MIEIWKDIEGYEGLYQVSNLGRVKSLNKINMQGHIRRERVLKNVSINGYSNVTLFKSGVRKMFRVHRLVAQAFIPNPEFKPEVNHIDEDKSNNRVSNLEWVNRKENMNHGTIRDRIKHNATKTRGLRICDNYKNIYPSIRQASRDLNIPSSLIVGVLKGKYKQTHGYSFKYID